RENAGARTILYWIANDACPPRQAAPSAPEPYPLLRAESISLTSGSSRNHQNATMSAGIALRTTIPTVIAIRQTRKFTLISTPRIRPTLPTADRQRVERS